MTENTGLYEMSEKNSNTNNDEELLREARENSQYGETFWSENWREMENDLRFLSGDQWPSSVLADRELEGRPCLVNNVMPTYIDQVVGDQRQNRPSIKIVGVDVPTVKTQDNNGQEVQTELKISSVSGQDDYSIADVMSGLIKNIEYSSNAESAQDIAFQQAVESGIGFMRVATDYVSDDTFDKDIYIKAISNQFSVIMDPNAREQDKSDMMWCLVNDKMPKNAFEAEYPGAKIEGGALSGDESSAWFDDKTVRVSEYFTREGYDKTVNLLSDGRSVNAEDMEPIQDELAAQGIEIVKTRKVKAYKVMWRIITGIEVLEGPIEIDCDTIPIVPVFGKELTIRNKTMYRSLIRHAKDAQRMANYWDSAATEAVALAPKAPFIGMEGHIEGREREWQEANTSNAAILTYIPQSPGDKGPRRDQPTSIPSAELTLSSTQTDKIKSTLGMFDASMGAQGNETSGRAINARQQQGDRGNFAYIDNLLKAIRRIGKILICMIPKTYDTERILRVRMLDDVEDSVKLNQQVFDEQSGEWVTIHDLNIAKFDLIVSAGPSYVTQKSEAAESMLQFAQSVPAAAEAAPDLIATNMDWPGSDAFAARLKKMVPRELLSRKEQEELAQQEPEEKPPTPEQELQAQAQQLQAQEMEIKSQELQVRTAEAQTGLAQAEAANTKAQAEIVKAQSTEQISEIKLAEAEARLNFKIAEMQDSIQCKMKEMAMEGQMHKNKQ